MTRRFLNSSVWLSLLQTCLLTGTIPANAAPGNISNTPLFTGSNVPANVFFELDDSRSMDYEVLAKSYWHFCSYDKNAHDDNGSDDCGGLATDGVFRLHASNDSAVLYLYSQPGNDNVYNLSCKGDYCVMDQCSSSVQSADWRIHSAAVNAIYYDPDVTYSPWVGTGMIDASFVSARSNPQSAIR